MSTIDLNLKFNHALHQMAAGICTQPRSNTLPGQSYSVQARTIGGATGYSDSSDPVSHVVN